MSSGYCKRFWVLALFFICLFCDLSSSMGQDIQDRILEEWQKAIYQFSNFGGDLSLEIKDSDRTQYLAGHLVFKDFQNFYLKDLNEGKLTGRNSDYSFSLIGKAPTSDKWYLEKIVEFPNKAEELSVMLRVEVHRAVPRVGLIPISYLFDSEIRTVRPLNHIEDGDFIEVDFEHFNSSVDIFGGRSLWQAGKLRLDPDNHFLPISYELKFELIGDDENIKSKMKGMALGQHEYDGIFPRKSYMEEMFNYFEFFIDGKETKDLKPIKTVVTVEMKNRSAKKLAESDFRLKTFGLPEPTKNKKRSTFLTLVYGLAIIVAFLSVFYLLSSFKVKR